MSSSKHTHHKDPVPIQQSLSKGIVGSLVAKVQQLKSIQQLFTDILPTHLKAYCQVMNLKENILILKVNSAAWATRLKMDCPHLLKELRFHPLLESVKEIEIRIRPS